MQVNPIGGGTVLAIAAAIGVGVWALTRKSSASTSSSTSSGTPSSSEPHTTPDTPQTPLAGGCVVDPVKLDAWALDRGFAAFYAIKSDIPPALPDLKAAFPAFNAASYDKIVVVTKGSSFWRYNAAGKAEAAPDLRDQYCKWKFKVPPSPTPAGDTTSNFTPNTDTAPPVIPGAGNKPKFPLLTDPREGVFQQ